MLGEIAIQDSEEGCRHVPETLSSETGLAAGGNTALLALVDSGWFPAKLNTLGHTSWTLYTSVLVGGGGGGNE